MAEQWWLDERVACERRLVQEQQLVIVEQNREINYLRRFIVEATGAEVPTRSTQDT